MDTIPTSKRARGVLYLIEHHLDLNLAIDHLIRECADEPKMKAAKDPRRLAHNILTIGGVGAEKVLNLQAWRDALDLIESEEHRKQASALQKQIDDKDAEIRQLNQELRSLNRDYRTLTMRALPDASSVSAPQEAEPVEV